MSPRSNLSVMSDLIAANDSNGLEKFLSYCDTKEQVLKSYIESEGTTQLQFLSKGFKAKALQQKIEIICE